jgi:hypothetical protein
MSIDKEAMKAGRKFEEDFEKRTGCHMQPNSGATPWAKLDNGNARILASLKATKHKSYPVDMNLIQEGVDAVHGPGGPGGRVLPAWALRLQSTTDFPEDFILMRLDDFMEIFSDNEAVMTSSSKAEKREALGRMSELDREE